MTRKRGGLKIFLRLGGVRFIQTELSFSGREKEKWMNTYTY
ncbi:MAG: hypothetical protein V2B19_25985 [Pseudomonadota bacterium]